MEFSTGKVAQMTFKAKIGKSMILTMKEIANTGDLNLPLSSYHNSVHSINGPGTFSAAQS